MGVFHRLVAFADPERAVAALHGATIGIEGDAPLAGLLGDMAEAVGATAVRLLPGTKAAYHAAAVLAAGGVVALPDAIAEPGEGAGLDQAGAPPNSRGAPRATPPQPRPPPRAPRPHGPPAPRAARRPPGPGAGGPGRGVWRAGRRGVAARRRGAPVARGGGWGRAPPLLQAGSSSARSERGRPSSSACGGATATPLRGPSPRGRRIRVKRSSRRRCARSARRPASRSGSSLRWT